ncbi:cytochrome c3 family protein, partial [Bacteroidota bacterium]
ETDKCSNCHSDNEKKPFDHKIRTGWALNEYHKNLSCLKCHRSKTNYSGIKGNCNDCHFAWSIDTFNHKVTGLILDRIHLEIDCVDCHDGRNFSIKPVCVNCHDDKSFPKDILGKFTKEQ